MSLKNVGFLVFPGEKFPSKQILQPSWFDRQSPRTYKCLPFSKFTNTYPGKIVDDAFSDVSRVLLRIPNSAGGFGAAVTPPEAPRIQCSKMVKIPVKCMSDNLKVIVVLALNTCFITRSSLIWSFKLSRTVTKLFKQYD